MKNLNLITVFQSFSNEEFEEFGEFVSSEFFNKADYIKNYFYKLKELYPGFENFEDAKEKIFLSLYPDRIYSDATIRKLNSELLKLAEEYLSIISLRQKKILKNTLVLEEFDKRKIDNLFTKKLENTYNLLDESKLKNEKFFRDLHILTDMEILFHSMRDRRNGFPKYYSSIENLDKFYIIQKLKKIIIITNEERTTASVVKDKKEMDNFIKLIQKNKYFEFAVIQILYNIFMLSRDSKKEYFENLKRIIIIHKNEISEEELEWVYFTMMNFCIQQINMGKNEYAKEELEIYKYIIEDNMLLYNNALESNLFKNIISSAVEAEDIDFAVNFKNEYSKFIFTEDKQDIISFCEANILYAKGKYEKALEILSKINFSDVNQKFSLRNLSLKIFLQNNMYEQAISAIDSYYQNLKREKTLPENIIKLYRSFIVLYKKLLNLKILPEKAELQLLLSEIKKTDTIAKAWLLKQAHEMT